MTQEVIDTGELPNDGSGDPLRLAFDKINNNFANLFALAPTANVELIDPTVVFGDDPSSSGSITNNYTLQANNIYITNPTQYVEVPAPAPEPTFLTFTTPSEPYANQEYINLGVLPNDGLGDPLRTAFNKINNNFTNLFSTTFNTTTIYTVGDAADQVIFETPANAFTQGTFQIRSSNTETPDSQNITINAQITNNNAGVKYTGYGTTFSGNALTRYNMDVSGSNVRLMVSPLNDEVLLHFITSQITFIGTTPPGIDIGLDGYPSGSVLGTEDDFILTTES